MKYLVVSCFLFFCTLQTFCQQEYFIYLQTDNSQPFYVRINSKVYSSSSTGYLILSNLSDSATNVTVGFPKSAFPEQQFNIPANHKDGGYVLKNADNGWGLFNLQTSEVISSSSPKEEKKKLELTGSRRNDAFSSLLANAVNDTAVLYTVNRPPKPLPAPPAAIPPEEKKNDTITIAKKELSRNDSAAIVKNRPGKKENSLTAKKNIQTNKASVAAAGRLPKVKGPAVIVKNNKPAAGTIGVAKKNLPVKDSVALAKNSPEIHDSSITAKDINQLEKDSAAAVKRLPKIKEPANIARNKKHAHDTILDVASTNVPAANPVKKDTAYLKDNVAIAKNTAQKKDTIIVMGDTRLPAKKKKSVFARNRPVKERRDTIIMMNGSKPEHNNPVAKNVTVKRDNLPATKQPGDSLQLIKKEIMQAPEEKRDALLNNKDAIIVEKIAVKKDTPASNPSSRIDTSEAVVGNEPVKPAETNPDTIASVPVKRLRPLVNKEAELLTDTSYVAVFVDESKDKFDTIRISIPFNEQLMLPGHEKPVTKMNAAGAEKIKTDSTPVTVTHDTAATTIKNDTAADKIVKEDTKIVPQENIPAITKLDAVSAGKKNDSSIKNNTQEPGMPVLQPDTLANSKPGSETVNKTRKDSIAVSVNRESVPPIVKKDSTPVISDSVQRTKKMHDSTPPQKAFVQPLIVNSDCKEVATGNDIDKLRIKMLLVTSDEDRISLAKKLFKQKCFLVQQVKALSELFKTDEGKYKWFDGAYAYVSDSGNFASLGDLIKDEYYLTRFKAMLRH